MIVLPQDGSAFALKSLDYLDLIFGPDHPLVPVLVYIVPCLPAGLTETGLHSRESARQLKQVSERSQSLADEILKEAKDVLVQYNFSPDRIQTVCQGRKMDIAADIADFAQTRMADGILLNCHGRSRIEAFFMGEVSLKLLTYPVPCPVWFLRGNVNAKDVLIAVDASENSLKAVDYAGFILGGTQSRIVLFHAKQTLGWFLPKVIMEDIPEISEAWSEKTDKTIATVMETARQMLSDAGIEESRIRTAVVDGTRHPARDVLAAAVENNCGTIILGRYGDSNNKEFPLGTIARKVIEAAQDMAVWIV